MKELLCFVVFVALVAAFCILLMKKWGAVDWLQVHGDRFLSRLFSCDFCLSFWVCTALWCAVACWYDEPLMVIGGVFSCPLTRQLV